MDKHLRQIRAFSALTGLPLCAFVLSFMLALWVHSATALSPIRFAWNLKEIVLSVAIEPRAAETMKLVEEPLLRALTAAAVRVALKNRPALTVSKERPQEFLAQPGIPQEKMDGRLHIHISVAPDSDDPRQILVTVLTARWGYIVPTDRDSYSISEKVEMTCTTRICSEELVNSIAVTVFDRVINAEASFKSSTRTNKKP